MLLLYGYFIFFSLSNLVLCTFVEKRAASHDDVGVSDRLPHQFPVLCKSKLSLCLDGLMNTASIACSWNHGTPFCLFIVSFLTNFVDLIS